MSTRSRPGRESRSVAGEPERFGPRQRFLCLLASLLAGLVVGCNEPNAEDLKPIETRQLPAPALNQVSLKDALQKRMSARLFNPKPLDDQTLSNLLWAANGINRPATGARTAPSAYDWRYVEVYFADAQGLWRYDAVHHAVEKLGATDVRSRTGVQDFVKDAPLDLIFVSDEGKMEEQKESTVMHNIYSGVGVGAVIQNVYLYCASAGLNVVVRASIDRELLHKTLRLKSNQKVIVSQTVGFPP